MMIVTIINVSWLSVCWQIFQQRPLLSKKLKRQAIDKHLDSLCHFCCNTWCMRVTRPSSDAPGNMSEESLSLYICQFTEKSSEKRMHVVTFLDIIIL